MPDCSTLPPALQVLLHKHALRSRRYALARRVGVVLSALAVWLLICCGIDRFWPLAGWIRFTAAALALIAAPVSLARSVYQWLVPRDDWVGTAEEIERHNPKLGQRLTTVISRLLGHPQYRGSDEILVHLAYQVERDVARERLSGEPQFRRLIMPWTLLFACLLLAGMLCFVSNLGLPRLAARLIDPLGNTLPVTTAQLVVHPGDCDLPQSAPLEIVVDAERIERSPVTLNWSDDGKTWNHSGMSPGRTNPGGDGQYAFTLASIDRDLRYFVTGGDATSPECAVRVLRRPAVSEFRINYTYPPYTGKPPLTVTNNDGLIEAPAGTEAQLTITATEPLQLALMTPPGGEKMLLARTDADNVRRGKFVVQREGRYSLDLVSTREQPGSGPLEPGSTRIHVLVDQPPAVHLAEAGASLRLNSRDFLPLSYEVSDDYGIASITLHAQSGAAPVIDIPIHESESAPAQEGSRMPMSRHLESQFNVDLSTLPLSIGDVLTLTLTARDSQGQPSTAAPVQILVAPRSVGLADRERIAELSDASVLAGNLTAELTEASKAIDDQGEETGARALAKCERHIASAADDAALLRRTLLHDDALGEPAEMSRALACWIDDAERLHCDATEILRPDPSNRQSPSSRAEASKDRIAATLEPSRKLQSSLNSASEGAVSAAILAEMENLAATKGRPAPSEPRAADRLQTALKRARDDINRATGELGLDTTADDLDPQLQARTTRMDAVITLQQAVDFAAAARSWVDLTLNRSSAAWQLEQRLSAAAEAEAVRAGADLVRARDLQLGAAAAMALRAMSPPADRTTLVRFAQAVSALTEPPRQSDNARMIVARRQLQEWAGATPVLSESAPAPVTTAASVTNGARTHSPRRAGVQSSAAIATTAPATTPSAAPAGVQPETLAFSAAAASANHRYAEVFILDDALLRCLQPQATRAIAAGDQLSAADLELQASQIARLTDQRRQVQQDMALAQQLDALSDQLRKLGDETRSPSPQTATTLAARLRNLADQIPSSVAPPRPDLEGRFVLAGKLNSKRRHVDDATAGEEQGDSSAQSLESAEETSIQNDPLVAAKRSAQAAGDDLLRKSPDFKLAAHHQDLTALALERAWDLSIHRAATARLAMVPSLRGLYMAEPALDVGPRSTAIAASPAPNGIGRAVFHNWRRVAPLQADGGPTAGHAPEPVGYEAALKAYFDVMGE